MKRHRITQTTSYQLKTIIISCIKHAKNSSQTHTSLECSMKSTPDEVVNETIEWLTCLGYDARKTVDETRFITRIDVYWSKNNYSISKFKSGESNV